MRLVHKLSQALSKATQRLHSKIVKHIHDICVYIYICKCIYIYIYVYKYICYIHLYVQGHIVSINAHISKQAPSKTSQGLCTHLFSPHTKSLRSSGCPSSPAGCPGGHMPTPSANWYQLNQWHLPTQQWTLLGQHRLLCKLALKPSLCSAQGPSAVQKTMPRGIYSPVNPGRFRYFR